jgi:hypothetical protein
MLRERKSTHQLVDVDRIVGAYDKKSIHGGVGDFSLRFITAVACADTLELENWLCESPTCANGP